MGSRVGHEDSGPLCASPIKEVAEGMGSGFVALHSKGTLVCKLFTNSGNWPDLGEAVSVGTARTHPVVRGSEYRK